jgi:hypothetical protein
MTISKKNAVLVEEIFSPDIEGISEWKSREYINTTGLKLGDNGNIRNNTPWSNKYKWDIKRKGDIPNGRPLEFRTIGFDTKIRSNRPIRSDIRANLLLRYPYCLHCHTYKTLCIDHKNDDYDEERVLDRFAQNEDDFQVLCNKCNKDFKHQDHVKEKKTGRLFSVKDRQIFMFDTFNYPWEIRCCDSEVMKYYKQYTYWYDIEDFRRKREIYVKMRSFLERIKTRVITKH